MKSKLSIIRALTLCGLLHGGPALAQEAVTDAVCVDTNLGEFCMRMLTEAAPQTVENFLNYVNDGDFDDTFIHRTEPDFVIQGGGYYSEPLAQEVEQDPPVVNEFQVSNTRGTVAMAKLPDDPNSATTEWFVNLADNVGLDTQNSGFTVFAEIIKGMEVVDDIGNLPRVDLTADLGPVFGRVPRQGSGAVDIEDLVLVHRVYVTDVIPVEPGEEPGGEDPGEVDEHPGFVAVAELENRRFSAPVRVGDRVMRMNFVLSTTPPEYVFMVETNQILLIDSPPEEVAVYDGAAKRLSIPSVRVGGRVYVDVELALTDQETLEFTLLSATRL